MGLFFKSNFLLPPIYAFISNTFALDFITIFTKMYPPWIFSLYNHVQFPTLFFLSVAFNTFFSTVFKHLQSTFTIRVNVDCNYKNQHTILYLILSDLRFSDSRQKTKDSEQYVIPESYLVFSHSNFDLILSSLKFKIAIFGFVDI